MNKAWNEYYENTKALQSSKFLIEAIESFNLAPGIAIDIGCGAGRDTRYLLEKGYAVTAIDKDPSVEDYLKRLPHSDNLKFICTAIEDYNFESYDLVNAHYALPFITNVSFDAAMKKIIDSMKPDGLFVGQLFGVDDEWNTPDTKMSFCERSVVNTFFHNFKHLDIREVNEEGSTASGDSKHWHVFNIIARK